MKDRVDRSRGLETLIVDMSRGTETLIAYCVGETEDVFNLLEGLNNSLTERIKFGVLLIVGSVCEPRDWVFPNTTVPNLYDLTHCLFKVHGLRYYLFIVGVTGVRYVQRFVGV